MSKERKICFLQGNEACAEGAIAAGANFYAGYPITPATEIAEGLSRLMPETGGKFIQMEDELSCMGAIIGASMAGAKSMTATSGPGFSLMQENIGYAVMTETPCVVVDVQRGGPSTGLPTLPAQADVMQARWGIHGDHAIIALAPASVAEMFSMTIDCFNLAEKYRTPVIFLPDAIIGHMREKVELPADDEIQLYPRRKPSVPPEDFKPYEPCEDGVPEMANMGDGYRFYVTGCVHDETGSPKMMQPKVSDALIRRLEGKIVNNRDDIVRYDEKYTEDAEVLVVAYGSVFRSAQSAVEALRKDGIKAGYFRPITLWPSPDREFLRAVESARAVVVPEMNLGQYAGELARILGANEVVRKLVPLTKVNGELIRPDEIYDCVKNVLEEA